MPSVNHAENGYREILKDDRSLAKFLKAMAKFDRRFCEEMNDRTDFTLRMEVRGNQGELLHCRVVDDGFDRPAGVEKRIDKRTKEEGW